MKNIKQFQGWRAEQITKVFLLSLGVFELNEYSSMKDKGYDFIAILKNNPDKKFGIDIKATKYSRNEIKSRYFPKTLVRDLPLIQFFVNYDKESGYFRIINTNISSELKLLKKDIFLREIETIL
jgi:hypothetical protein